MAFRKLIRFLHSCGGKAVGNHGIEVQCAGGHSLQNEFKIAAQIEAQLTRGALRAWSVACANERELFAVEPFRGERIETRERFGGRLGRPEQVGAGQSS